MADLVTTLSQVVARTADIPNVLANIIANYVRDPTFLHDDDYPYIDGDISAHYMINCVKLSVDIGHTGHNSHDHQWVVWRPGSAGYWQAERCTTHEGMYALLTGESTSNPYNDVCVWIELRRQLYDAATIRAEARRKK